MWRAAIIKSTISRAVALCAIVVLIGLLPWLSGQSPEYTILRARYADREPSDEALGMIRAELGLDQGPVHLFLAWAANVLRGDLGRSWITNTPVGPGTVDALAVSMTLMAYAVVVAMVVAAAVCVPAVARGLAGNPGRGSGFAAAAMTAFPEFLLAAMLLVVGAVWLGWFPPYGWQGIQNTVLPALALGVPAGGLMGRLLSEAISLAFAEKWVATWAMAGAGRARLTAAVLRRALPSVMSQIGLVLIGLTGGAVAAEKVFAVPGLGRAVLGAASAQDVPALQAGVLALLVLALGAGLLSAAARHLLVGSAVRSGTVPVPEASGGSRRRDVAVPFLAGGALVLVVVAGLFRDPFATGNGRLAAPGWDLPFGADASGRDLLARVGHGAVSTLGTAVLVVLACLVIGVVVGLFPLAAAGPLEVANAAPPILAGLLVAVITGPSPEGAALAVAVVSWAPLAAHTASLVQEARARPYVRILPVLGVGRGRVLWRYILPVVLGPVFRHSMLRVPGITLALAALGFLGLGPHQPSPEWGLILAEGINYVERAPWAVVAPASALVLASVLAVSLSSLSRPSGFSPSRPSPRSLCTPDTP
ncbi:MULTISPECIES: ABC transporter permease subunit [Arthrobacter]|uniref:ABC transporter permease subunit n=1 Tax=Arthrobacter terricola TaxID=2547396 RepID=A0A4R5KY72_9MICC|nr:MULTISPECIES: ABC transporter permease subunit [Arthrobacter]MBT8160309.1 ABC transporter permease subunit [Arthrobacter sp. GN70]TDF99990.1 ABC transporter permease subunit [Arthrobacter terricola]